MHTEITTMPYEERNFTCTVNADPALTGFDVEFRRLTESESLETITGNIASDVPAMHTTNIALTRHRMVGYMIVL